mmetsp:Transcript_29785/g.53889  ORF Transcript_29785/g.53889 Transcript_29785/m.53889 type:complete len:952 (+) Transcript_29785:214-3069(+)
MSMEKQNPILAVPHDPSIQFVLSDLSATPTGSPNTSRTQAEERTKSIDARLKRKWKRQVEKERAYERTKAEKAKEESSDPNNSSSFIELTQDLLVPCIDDSICSENSFEQTNKSPDIDQETTKLADLSDSLLDAVEPPVVTPDEKESHKVQGALNTSEEKYSQKDEEYCKFHEQLYAPQDDEYSSFLKGLENENGDPSAEDFAKWLHGIDKDIQPIAPLDDTLETMKAPTKRVAFSKETTIRFFSRTREEFSQLRRKCKNTKRGSGNDEECDGEDWPLFKYLDHKLKKIQESSAWDDPMSAVTDMFVSKEVKEKFSPMICVCDNPLGESEQESSDPTARSLADLDEDEELGPAKKLASTRAAAATLTIAKDRKDPCLVSHESSESASGSIAALWFAESVKNSHDEMPDRGDSFVCPAASPSSSKCSSPHKPYKESDSSSRITIEPPKSLSVIKESALPRFEVSREEMSDRNVPVEESLPWLAEDLDDSPDTGAKSILSADPLNESALSLDRSLGRNTNSNLLRKVSEHLNVSALSASTTNSSSVDQEYSGVVPKDRSFLSTSSSSTRDLKTATALKKLLEPPDGVLQDTSANESGTKTITVSVAALDVVVRSNEKNTRTQHSSDLNDAMGGELLSPRSSEGSDYSIETPFDQKKHVVKAAKRWAASQKAGHRSSSSTFTSTGSVQQRQKQIQVVKAAKRWAATQKTSTKPMRVLSPTPEDGPDLDESRDWDENIVNTSVDISEATDDVWKGVKVTPGKEDGGYVDSSDPWLEEEGPDWDESKEWDAFALHPDMTTMTASVSNEDSSFEETEEWVAFAAGGVKKETLSNETWSASFPQAEIAACTAGDIIPTSCADPAKSPRKQVRVSPVKQAVPSTRVQQIAREFERLHGGYECPTKCDISPLTPSTPWADVDRRKDTDTVEYAYPDLQQPVLDESLDDSKNNSPVSVTRM